MNAESYSFLQVEADEEPMLFASIFSPAEHEQACIGHLRGDFGRGTEFWTTWWDKHEELKNQDFQNELGDLVNTLRKNGPLKNLSAMQCQRQPENVDFRRNEMLFFAGQHGMAMQP